MLMVGAIAVIRYAQRNSARRPWLVQLMCRRPTKVAAVALANKTAEPCGRYGHCGTLPRSAGNAGGRVGNAVETRPGCSCADEVGKGRRELMQQAG